MSWTWTARCSWCRTACRGSSTPTAMSIAPPRSGALRTRCIERARRAARHRRSPLAQPAAGSGDPVLHPDVGDFLLLRDAHAARLLHDEAVVVRPAACVAGLRRV